MDNDTKYHSTPQYFRHIPVQFDNINLIKHFFNVRRRKKRTFFRCRLNINTFLRVKLHIVIAEASKTTRTLFVKLDPSKTA